MALAAPRAASIIGGRLRANRSSTGAVSQLNIEVSRFTDTWMKCGNRWYAIASQDTRIPDEG